jgi:hypothetical protein
LLAPLPFLACPDGLIPTCRRAATCEDTVMIAERLISVKATCHPSVIFRNLRMALIYA